MGSRFCHLPDVSKAVKWPFVVPVQATTESRCLRLSGELHLNSGYTTGGEWDFQCL